MVQESEKIDHALARGKVKNISWLKRLNPFAGELHLSGEQKAKVAFAAVTAAMIGAFVTSKVAQWMTQGSESPTR